MGIQQSKPKKNTEITENKSSLKKSKSIGRSKSSLSQKQNAPFKQEIIDFSTQLNSMAALSNTTTESLTYNVLNKMPFKGHHSSLPTCSKITSRNDYVFICLDCSLNNRAYLCQKCFDKGNHQSHRFSVFQNNDGYQQLFCRCGDPQFMKKKTTCKDHTEAPKMPTSVTVQAKQLAKFKAYFGQIFKVMFNLMEKNRDYILYAATFEYLKKLTDQNLYYSKMFAEFLLSENSVDFQQSNLLKRIKTKKAFSQNEYQVMRNINFLNEYKKPILVEIITGLNYNKSTEGLTQFVFNFAGKLDILNDLAKQDNLIFGQGFSNIKDFYSYLIKTKEDASQIWKAVVQNKMMSNFLRDDQSLKAILKNLINQEKSIIAILEQILEKDVSQSQRYVIACLMIISPDFFFMKKNTKVKNLSKDLQNLFAKYYSNIYKKLTIRQRNDPIYPRLLLLLPFFSFGQTVINKMWQEIQRRVELLEETKDRDAIKEATWNFFAFLTTLVGEYVAWEHMVMQTASQFQLDYYTKDKDLLKKVLIQNFDKTPKILRHRLLSLLDKFSQNKRQLAKDVVKKQLRFNAKKDKYYYIGKQLSNNLCRFEDFVIGQQLPLGQWHQFVGKVFFTDSVYRFYPTLIKIAQKALKNDLQQVKTVSNLSIFFSLMNKKDKNYIKQTTRKYILELPDANQNTYYVLAGIRNRYDLDIDQMQQKGQNGRKKVKLDLITQIRDKKYQEMKQKQRRAKQKMMKAALQDSEKQEQSNQEIPAEVCYICKEKDVKDRRFIYPCFFTQNSVVSTLLKSQVTDLDMNICLHHMHQDCFQKIKFKGQCPTCKFDFNSYIPARPLDQQSFTKQWLKTFERIIAQFNLNTGKSFSSDWATIFLTYLTYSRSFRVLLKSTELQTRQREKIDQLIMITYKNQMRKWPDLTKAALKKAQKTVKGQVRRQSNEKKVVKSIVLDVIMEQITGQAIKNQKRTLKKVRDMMSSIGSQYAKIIKDCNEWLKNNEDVQKIYQQNVEGEIKDMFEIRDVPKKADQFMKTTSIKCPMCNKYQPSCWQCLFCSKRSCAYCLSTRNHCQYDHRGSAIYLHLNDAEFQLMHENRTIKRESLYKNEYLQGWRRNKDPEGWQANTEQIYKFFDKILHSQSVKQKINPDDQSNDGINNWNGNLWNNNNDNQQQQEQEQQQQQKEEEDNDGYMDEDD